MAIKYKDLTQYKNTIGAVSIDGMCFQLCDYVECIGGLWFAAAYIEVDGTFSEDNYSSFNIIFKKQHLKNSDIRLAYLPEDLLSRVQPRFEDENETIMLIARLSKEVSRLNARLMKKKKRA